MASLTPPGPVWPWPTDCFGSGEIAQNSPFAHGTGVIPWPEAFVVILTADLSGRRSRTRSLHDAVPDADLHPRDQYAPGPAEGRKMMEAYANFTQEVRDNGMLRGRRGAPANHHGHDGQGPETASVQVLTRSCPTLEMLCVH